MMRKVVLLSVLGLTVGLAACRSSSRPTPPPPPSGAASVDPANQSAPPVWGRLDCKRASTNPEIVSAFSNDKLQCEQLAGIREGDGVTGALESCMGERGYRYRLKQEHDAYCSRVKRTSSR